MIPAGMRRELQYAKKEGVPETMCDRCGCPHEKHENASDCIAYWRDQTARLEFQLVALREAEHLERRSIPRYVAG